MEKEGYNAIQVGFREKKSARLSKPEAGHVGHSGGKGFYHVKEFRVTDPGAYEVGQQVSVAELFQIGDEVDVTGRAKGRGFQGVMKRHGFGGGKASHGSGFQRAPGSIGCSAWPSRVIKGKKLPGQMGNNVVTQKRLTIVDIRKDENIMLVQGAVPGARNGLVSIYARA